MKKMIMIMGVLGMLMGCGPLVEVPPSCKGKLNTPSGLEEGIIEPSTFRLDYVLVGVGDSAIIVDGSDFADREELVVFLPKDKLNLKVDVRFTASISTEVANLNKVFGKVPADELRDRVSFIPMKKIFDTYGRNTLREVVRSVLTKYDLQYIMENRDLVNAEIIKQTIEMTKNTPVSFSQLGMADLQPPKIIVEAQEAAKEKEVAIAKAEAETAIKLQQATSALQVALKQQEVELTEAETQLKVDQLLSKGVSETWVTQKMLRNMEAMILSTNKVFFIPLEAMKNPNLMMGAMNMATVPTPVEAGKK